jgi:hypothetical protein
METLERIAAAVEPHVLRAYAAVLVGRAGQRAPENLRTSFQLLPAGESVKIAENTSDDRALLVDVLGTSGVGLRFSSSPIPATNSFIGGQLAGFAQVFVLYPGDALFVQALAASTVQVGQEYF